jgi:pteridine reductase
MLSPLPLAGRQILVTGAGRRLGRAVAEGIVAAGADVVLVVRSSVDGADAVASLARERGQRAEVVVADLADRRSTDAAVSRALELAAPRGGLDSFVHAAASYEKGSLEETSDELWDRVLEMNLTLPFRLARALAPALARSPRGGSIVLFSELAAFLPFADRFAHSVAKGGVVPLVRSLAKSLAPGIRVNAVSPGPNLPPENLSAEERARAFERIPMGDPGGPDEVVRAVLHLLVSERVTGEVLRVDGGRRLL